MQQFLLFVVHVTFQVLDLRPVGNLYSVSYFQGAVDFDPVAGTFSINSLGSKDFFVTN